MQVLWELKCSEQSGADVIPKQINFTLPALISDQSNINDPLHLLLATAPAHTPPLPFQEPRTTTIAGTYNATANLQHQHTHTHTLSISTSLPPPPFATTYLAATNSYMPRTAITNISSKPETIFLPSYTDI